MIAFLTSDGLVAHFEADAPVTTSAEPIRIALAQIRAQRLKSFFTLLGVVIGVMFLIAVVSIVEGMSSYMENDFAVYNRLWAEYFKEAQPCRTTVEVTRLPTPIAIELKCIAEVRTP